MQSLEGRVALVTGGSRGIGKGIAKAYIDAGAQVMISSRKAESCEAAVAELGPRAHWSAGHVARAEDAERIVGETLERFGRLDVLVNNAATNPWAGLTIDVDLPRWQKTIDVNLTAPLVWTQLAWRRWMRENGGVVLHISSVGAFATNPILGTYGVTKAALVHLTKQLAAELGPAVRVNAIAPGLVKTDFARALWEGEGGDRTAERYPLRRLGTPEDIGQAALYLAADSGSWITGQTLVLDGGGLVAFSQV